mmetsp:Transcript_37887/g.95831  ORF Transcript_37887/g.95831 Transcript_37887/m.95831 type:complete len:219 (+) Transcript_37887:476-1132(+)
MCTTTGWSTVTTRRGWPSCRCQHCMCLIQHPPAHPPAASQHPKASSAAWHGAPLPTSCWQRGRATSSACGTRPLVPAWQQGMATTGQKGPARSNSNTSHSVGMAVSWQLQRMTARCGSGRCQHCWIGQTGCQSRSGPQVLHAQQLLQQVMLLMPLAVLQMRQTRMGCASSCAHWRSELHWQKQRQPSRQHSDLLQRQRQHVRRHCEHRRRRLQQGRGH